MFRLFTLLGLLVSASACGSTKPEAETAANDKASPPVFADGATSPVALSDAPTPTAALPDEATLAELLAKTQALPPSLREVALLDDGHFVVLHTVSPYDEWWEQQRRSGEAEAIEERVAAARQACYAEAANPALDGWEQAEAENECEAITEGPSDYLDSNQSPCEDLIVELYTLDGLQLVHRRELASMLCAPTASIEVADLNADQRPEIVIGYGGDDQLVIPATGAREETWLAVVDGELEPIFELQTSSDHPVEPSFTTDVEWTDLDGDARLDLVLHRRDYDEMDPSAETEAELHCLYRPDLRTWACPEP